MSAVPPAQPPSSGVRLNLGVAPDPSSIPSNASAPAPAPTIAAAALPPAQMVLSGNQFARPTRLFTLVFFAIALICCAVMVVFITITLMKRRRQRIIFLQRRRAFGLDLTRRADLAHTRSRRHSGEHVRPTRHLMPPLVEGVLVVHPDGEEQVACASPGIQKEVSPPHRDPEIELSSSL